MGQSEESKASAVETPGADVKMGQSEESNVLSVEAPGSDGKLGQSEDSNASAVRTSGVNSKMGQSKESKASAVETPGADVKMGQSEDSNVLSVEAPCSDCEMEQSEESKASAFETSVTDCKMEQSEELNASAETTRDHRKRSAEAPGSDCKMEQSEESKDSAFKALGADCKMEESEESMSSAVEASVTDCKMKQLEESNASTVETSGDCKMENLEQLNASASNSRDHRKRSAEAEYSSYEAAGVGKKYTKPKLDQGGFSTTESYSATEYLSMQHMSTYPEIYKFLDDDFDNTIDRNSDCWCFHLKRSIFSREERRLFNQNIFYHHSEVFEQLLMVSKRKSKQRLNIVSTVGFEMWEYIFDEIQNNHEFMDFIPCIERDDLMDSIIKIIGITKVYPLR